MFPRGFKAEANRISLSIRRELGLEPHSPLCPRSLAEHLLIPVVQLRDLSQKHPVIAKHVDYFVNVNPWVFSAITIFHGSHRLIVHNDCHAPTRRRANIAHELAHALLHHPPHPPFCKRGKRVFNHQLENEASWLGPTLLVSNEAAHWARRSGMTEGTAALHFGVREPLNNRLQ